MSAHYLSKAEHKFSHSPNSNLFNPLLFAMSFEDLVMLDCMLFSLLKENILDTGKYFKMVSNAFRT